MKKRNLYLVKNDLSQNEVSNVSEIRNEFFDKEARYDQLGFNAGILLSMVIAVLMSYIFSINNINPILIFPVMLPTLFCSIILSKFLSEICFKLVESNTKISK